MTQPYKETLVTIRSGRGATLKELSFGALLIAVLTIALVGCGINLNVNAIPTWTPLPTPTPMVITPIAASGYSTYNNTLYHYNISYPSNWIAPSTNPAVQNFSVANYDQEIYQPSVVLPPFSKVEIDVYANPKYVASTVLFQTVVGSPGSPKATVISQQQTMLAGWYATEVVWSTAANSTPTITYLVQVRNYILFIYETNAVKGQPSPVFAHMLNSLSIYG
jgi:hypothetical protein